MRIPLPRHGENKGLILRVHMVRIVLAYLQEMIPDPLPHSFVLNQAIITPCNGIRASNMS